MSKHEPKTINLTDNEIKILVDRLYDTVKNNPQFKNKTASTLNEIEFMAFIEIVLTKARKNKHSITYILDEQKKRRNEIEEEYNTKKKTYNSHQLKAEELKKKKIIAKIESEINFDVVTPEYLQTIYYKIKKGKKSYRLSSLCEILFIELGTSSKDFKKKTNSSNCIEYTCFYHSWLHMSSVLDFKVRIYKSEANISVETEGFHTQEDYINLILVGKMTKKKNSWEIKTDYTEKSTYLHNTIDIVCDKDNLQSIEDFVDVTCLQCEIKANTSSGYEGSSLGILIKEDELTDTVKTNIKRKLMLERKNVLLEFNTNIIDIDDIQVHNKKVDDPKFELIAKKTFCLLTFIPELKQYYISKLRISDDLAPIIDVYNKTNPYKNCQINANYINKGQVDIEIYNDFKKAYTTLTIFLEANSDGVLTGLCNIPASTQQPLAGPFFTMIAIDDKEIKVGQYDSDTLPDSPGIGELKKTLIKKYKSTIAHYNIMFQLTTIS